MWTMMCFLIANMWLCAGLIANNAWTLLPAIGFFINAVYFAFKGD